MLYPLLIHTFIELVQRGAPAEAAALLTRHGPRLAELGGEAAAARSQELRDLAAVTAPRQLASNRVVQVSVYVEREAARSQSCRIWWR